MDLLQESQAQPAKAPKKGGTFACMGLARPILKAVERKGYKLATPIQRKCIPAILTGRDVVAMARTGSGKSAAFLLPLIDRLKIRQPKTEIRALVLSPTRELAMQTFKFAREFTKFTNLVSKLIIGGESLEKDFKIMTECPDILVATPGRLAHVLVEMKLKLQDIKVVVFDEADRLFEPSFREIEQISEICRRLPDSRQTLLFSATMPQRLAEFATAGLKNPLFVRLDVEFNLSETLKSIHLHCNQLDKFPILIYLLKQVVTTNQAVVVFMPTRHHIEYSKMLLDNSRIECTHVYSSMDPEARKINIDKFTHKKCRVMLVTDIAARGIDIPFLDVVINFNFPFKPKLFIHRVGRVARAGRTGYAISLVSHDETAYLNDLHVFLGQPIQLASEVETTLSKGSDMSELPDKVLGSVPQSVCDNENEIIKLWHQHNDELNSMQKVCDNAMKPFLKTREPPAPTSVKASKDLHKKVIGIHPLFKIYMAPSDENRVEQEHNMLERIKSYKPQTTIFEVGHIKGNQKTEAYGVMKNKRQRHDKLAEKKARQDSVAVSSDPVDFEESKFYLNYQPADHAREKGLELEKNSFTSDLRRATLDIIGDEEGTIKRQKHQQMWDRKRKKYVNATDDSKSVKKIRTESGTLISASYRSGIFEKWKSRSKIDQQEDQPDVDSNHDQLDKLRSKLKAPKRRGRELKNPDQMLKERSKVEKMNYIMRSKISKRSTKSSKNAPKTSNRPSKSPRKSGKSKRPSKKRT